MSKVKHFIEEYIPTPTLALMPLTLIAIIVHIVSELSVGFSDFFNRYIGSAFRAIFATVTSPLPFSLAECVVILLPVLAISLFIFCAKRINRSNRDGLRAVFGLLGVLLWMYSMFIFTTTVAYNGSPLSEKLELEEKPVSVDELENAARYMIELMNEELDELDFNYGAGAVMPYSLDELNSRLLDAYESFTAKQSFIATFPSKIKQIALSEPMTYTHMSGMYTYYTGEANLNVNYPDFNHPYTAAHELAHQRGVLPENEANFVAFLVCLESDDPFIRYSGLLNMYQYLNSALYSADYDRFAEVYSSLDRRVIGELQAYSSFFDKYRENKAADISSALNDTYLKSHGQTAGEKSYGMVVDLAVAWVNNGGLNG